MIERKERTRPQNWADFHRSIHRRWLLPILYLDWLTDWAAFLLSRTAFLDVLEYCGSFSILIAVIFYFVGAPQRKKLMHYQAWQVINTAQGKGGNGGRADALHELNDDHVPLAGVDLSDAFLQYMELEKADLRRCKLSGADLRNADLSRSNLDLSDLIFTNLRSAQLQDVDFTEANLTDADVMGATLSRAKMGGCDLTRADLRQAVLTGLIDWKSIASVQLANIHGVQNPPDGFVAWAMSNGAVDITDDSRWQAAIKRAFPEK